LRSSELYDPVADDWTSGPSLGSGVSFAGCAVWGRGEVMLVRQTSCIGDGWIQCIGIHTRGMGRTWVVYANMPI